MPVRWKQASQCLVLNADESSNIYYDTTDKNADFQVENETAVGVNVMVCFQESHMLPYNYKYKMHIIVLEGAADSLCPLYHKDGLVKPTELIECFQVDVSNAKFMPPPPLFIPWHSREL